ncbi:hypothetical protein [Prosthecobacter sp.]|uniref:hypothetical protein n=1 Tax=Prosthecobacter sp. TaxID=1965333 RepID=UPI002ABCE662|nr:hypothetical protein [Prosthecobacter sp.]MDZ4402361.1 hypothetical protein [Prosthecobacter sp.]
MSATQVIELYDALPKQEQLLVAEHVGKTSAPKESEQESQAEFKGLVQRVFDKHGKLMERLAQ